MRKLTAFAVVLMTGLVGFGAGCSGGTGDSSGDSWGDSSGDSWGDSSGMTITKTCLKTTCDVWQEDASDACSSCMDACFSASYGCDYSSACDVSCDPAECGDWARDNCEVQGFKVTTPVDSSAEVLEACKRSINHIQSCGYEAGVTLENCAVFAAVERPEVAPFYDCSAKIPCDSLSDPDAWQACQLPPSSFGNEICAKLDAKCSGHCTPEDRDWLNGEGSFLRPEVMKALDYCVGQTSCTDVRACVFAWSQAVGL